MNKKQIIKPVSVGRTIKKSDTGQVLLYIDVMLSEGVWVTWVIPEMSTKIIDNEV
jgi:hypothetical protein